MNLKEKTLKSLAVVYFYKFLWMGVNFGRSVIIARLLFPEDFAIVALAFTFIYLVEQLFTFGFSKILIHKKEITTDEINTAFTLNIIQNVIFFLIIYFGSPLVAAFYDKPVLDLVVKLLGFQVLMQCIGFIPRVMLQKEMRFKELESIQFASNIISTIILIALAYTGWSYWSLVLSSIVGALLQSITFLFLSRINARLCLQRSIVRQYIKSGTIIYLTALLTYLRSSIDIMLIGKISGLLILGYYTVGKQWSRYFYTMLFAHLNNVLFPGYAYIQDDTFRLSQALKKIFRLVIPIMLPCYIGFLIIAPDFVRIFLGQKWLPAVPLLQLLLLSMCFEPESWFFIPISDAIGRFSIRLILSVFNVFALLILFPLFGYFGGLIGYGIAIFLVTILSYVVSFWLICKKELGITWKTLWTNIRGVVWSVLSMSIVLVVSQNFLSSYSDLNRLVIKVIGGVCVYCLSFLCFEPSIILMEYKTIIKSYIKKNKI